MRVWSGRGFPGMALTILAFLLASSAIAFAQSHEEPLLLTLTQHRVVEDADQPHGELLIPFEGDEGEPGTVVEYQVTAKNVSTQPLGDLLLRLWIPEGTLYLEGMEQLDRTVALLQFSIDEGQTFRAAPIRYTITRPDGSQEQAIATPDMYTDLRLVFLRPLISGEEVTFSYRVELR